MKKDTHVEFQKKLENKFGNKFTLLSQYIDSSANVKVRCNECGFITEKQAVKLLYRGTCRGCFNRRHTKTHEEFAKQVSEKYGNEFTLLSKYTYARDRVKVRHNECGAEFELIASSLLPRGHGGCLFCQPKRLRKKFAKTKEDFAKQVEILSGGEYVFIGNYINANTRALFRHNKCGREYMAKPNGFLQGKRCRQCMNEARRIKNNINQKITRRIRGRIWVALREYTKSASTMALLGCSIKQLRKHLENLFMEGMSWNNYGRGGWELDHIRPCASFDLSKESEQRECFHYTNLQPLWAKENSTKNSLWNGKHYRGKFNALSSR